MTKSRNAQTFEKKLDSNLLSLFKKIPLPLRWRAFTVGFSFYIIYFLIALFSGKLYIAIWSRMHLVQISFSICIMVSFYLWEKFQSEFIEFMKRIEKIIDNSEKYEEFVDNTIIRFKSPLSFLIPIPLMIISGSYFYFGVYPKLPDNFFPIIASFHYLALLFSFFMIYLLGSKGFWYLYTIAQLYKDVAQKSTVPFFVLLKQPFKEFSEFPFHVSLYLLKIEVTALPILIYIIYYYNIKIGEGLMIFAAIGLFISISVIFCLFFIINNSIHTTILKSKDVRFAEIISQLEECEKEIFEKMKSKFMTNKINAVEELLHYHAYLDRIRKEVVDVPEKPSKFMRLSELLVSILPTGLLVQIIKPAIEKFIAFYLTD